MELKSVNWLKLGKTVGLHSLFWILIVFYFAWGFGFATITPRIAFLNTLFFLPGYMTMAYVLLYFLIPRYLLRDNIWYLLLGFFILVSVCAIYSILAQMFINSVTNYDVAPIGAGRNVMPFVHVGGIAASIELLKYRYLQKKQSSKEEQQRSVTAPADATLGFLYFRSDRKMVKVFLDEILFIESFKDYVVIHRENEPDLRIKQTLNHLESMLPENLFLRIHRSFIVSAKRIKAFTKKDVEIGKVELPIGKSYTEGFRKFVPEDMDLPGGVEER